MRHYDFPLQFRSLYDKAAGLYAKGLRGAASFFTDAEKAWLAANGLTPQHLYDYAEDECASREPGYDQALAIELVRRGYFFIEQGGRPSGHVLDESRLPAKTDAVKGIEWLPRIIPKARAKLQGELPATLMYCCSGDRRFFKAHDILPAEFLSLVWKHPRDDAAIIDWVAARGGQARTTA